MGLVDIERGESALDAARTFWAAIERGDNVEAFGLIDPAAAREAAEQGRDALMWAAYKGRPAFVKALRPASDLSATDSGSRDAIMLAAAGGSTDALWATMDKQPRPAWDGVDAVGDSAIMIAARGGLAEALDVLATARFRSQSQLVKRALTLTLST